MATSRNAIVELSPYDRGLLERIVDLLEPKPVDTSFADVHQLVEGSPRVHERVSSQAGLASFNTQGQPNWSVARADADGKTFHGQPDYAGIYDTGGAEETQ